MHRNMIFKISVCLVSVLLSVVAAEIYIRWFHFGDVDTDMLQKRLESVSVKMMMQPDPDPVIYYGLKPNLRVPWLGKLIFTGETGWRTSMEPRATRPDAFNIVVMGDSTPFGWNINYEESYPELIRAGLETRLERPVDLINTSVPGYNAWQYERLFETRIIPLNPDLLILHYDHNDLEPTSSFQPSDFLAAQYGDNPLHSALIKYVIRAVRIAVNNAQKRRMVGDYERVAEYIAAGPLYDDHLTALARLAQTAKAHSVPVLVVIYNGYVRRDPDYEIHPIYKRLHREKAEFFQAQGFHVVDLYPFYQDVLARRGWNDLREWWNSNIDPVDAHPNPDGHRFIADIVLDAIMTQGPVSLFNRR